ncbi:glycosyltransferase family 4 protein [Variovorax sp. J22R115]|uniref:glycosyltransferase family 4 protein n=1 Tax=Variovorax sp. J22R115 TaxID=3053509 RepID=UPI0025790A5D|nr:glycosyltransferase [Variovorax sp. J22R115]MDM0049024.1 glycosyltransferase [Variovorax sp. J22R115]
MKISYVNSVCVRNDAISNAIKDELRILQQAGHGDVRLFAFECDHAELPFKPCKSIADIVQDPHFLGSDLVVFHFGIYYSLFNLFPAIPKKMRKLVVFHNITPASVVPDKDRWLIEKSFAQLDNIRWADHVSCVSRTNLGVLRSRGLAVSANVVPLSIHSELRPPLRKPSFDDDVVRIAYVGRFTKAKGPEELLTSVETTCSDLQSKRIELDLVGNLSFSDPATVQNVRQRSNDLMIRFPDRLIIRIHGNAPDEVKHAILRNADIFALPTYHEGFCVPIIEAISSGCQVIVYNNSNTPDVTAEFGTLVPTGDVNEFANALRSMMAVVRSEKWRGGGPNSYDQFLAAAEHHVHQFSPDSVAPKFLQTVYGLMAA